MGRRFKSLTPGLWVLAVVLLGAALTGVSVRAVHDSVQQREHLLFDREIERLKNSLQNQLNQQALLLTAVRGVFAASQDVTIDEFEHFAGSLELKARFPATAALGYAHRVPERELDAYVARRSEAIPDYKFRYMSPQHQRGSEDRFVIELIQPAAWRPT